MHIRNKMHVCILYMYFILYLHFVGLLNTKFMIKRTERKASRYLVLNKENYTKRTSRFWGSTRRVVVNFLPAFRYNLRIHES
jgi:hypothetical protein